MSFWIFVFCSLTLNLRMQCICPYDPTKRTGSSLDPQLGPVLLFGTGGALVEAPTLGHVQMKLLDM